MASRQDVENLMLSTGELTISGDSGSHCPLCRILGETRLTLSSEKGLLKVRLESEDVQKSLKEQMARCYGNRRQQLIPGRKVKKQGKKIKIQEYYILGQNVATADILELVELLLERDYPDVAIFDGSIPGRVGPIFVPESYLPKKPKVVDPDIAQNIKEQFPEDKKLIGDIKQTEGDLLERQVYDALRLHFKSRSHEDVLIIQGIELVKIGGERGKDVQELDFLIVNFTHQYVLNIEVKKWLGQIQGKPENIIEKARDQLESNKELFEDWFAADLKGKWRYFSALFCLDMEQLLKDCVHCKDFIATSQQELLIILDLVEKVKLQYILSSFFLKFYSDFTFFIAVS